MTDDELIEKMARAMCPDNMVIGPFLRAEVTAALAVARPIIEAQERERCAAKAHQAWLDGVPVAEISKSIREGERE